MLLHVALCVCTVGVGVTSEVTRHAHFARFFMFSWGKFSDSVCGTAFLRSRGSGFWGDLQLARCPDSVLSERLTLMYTEQQVEF